MKYLPIIIDENGKSYENVKYRNLGEAMDALEECIKTFKEYRDNQIIDAYVMNIITGKQIRP